MRVHKLKIQPQYFREVESGRKTFEIRKDDRDYKTGDTLELAEFDKGQFTGRLLTMVVTYTLRDCEQYGLKKGFVILATKKAQ